VKLSILAVVSTVSCVAAAAACSSSSSSNSPVDSGTGGGGEGGTTGEGGVADAGGDSAGGSLPYVGTVTASKEGTVFALGASFFPTPASTTTATCPAAGMQSGSCCYIPPSAASDAGAADAGATVTAESAGVITFKDGTAAVAALNPTGAGGYFVQSTNNPSVKWTAGDTLAVSAAGATVQAFSGSLTTVDDFAGVVPALSSTAAPIPITADLAVSWTAGNGTNVTISLAAFKGKAGDGLITCSVSDTGSTTVPLALLSKLTTGDTGLMSLVRTSLTKVTGPNATVGLIGTTTTGGVVKYQ
jgi:hypothetical protein